jgi:Protein of unknown function (DUF2948)
MTATSDKLRLKAMDAEDLAVISACLQDARIPLREMAYLPGEHRFMAAFTRYRREKQADPRSCEGLTEREAALVFDDVEDVKYRGIEPDAADREFVLLTIATEPGQAHLVHVDLVFEGDARIQLRTNRITARLDDFGEVRPCTVTPCDHEASELPGWTESYDGKA